MQYSVEVIASYIIKNLSDETVDVTHLKLQKLL